MPQLSFLEEFDKTKARKEKLSKDLLSAIHSFKYYRTCARCSQMPESYQTKLDYVILSLCELAAAVSMDTAQNLKYYKDQAKEKAYLHMTEPPEHSQVIEYLHTGASRLKTTIRGAQTLITKHFNQANKVFASLEQLLH